MGTLTASLSAGISGHRVHIGDRGADDLAAGFFKRLCLRDIAVDICEAEH